MTRDLGVRMGRLSGALAAGALLVAGCASSTLVNVWRDPSYGRRPMSDVAIVAMIKDPAQRRLWEVGFAREFRAHGIEATPSYQLFPNDVPDTDQLVDAVRDRGFDGLVMSHRLATAREVSYIPGYTTLEPVIVRSRWSGAYRTLYAGVRHPGYHEVNQIVRYRTDVWTLAGDGRMVWTGTSETMDPSSIQQVNREISHMIVPELVKQGIIPGDKGGARSTRRRVA